MFPFIIAISFLVISIYANHPVDDTIYVNAVYGQKSTTDGNWKLKTIKPCTSCGDSEFPGSRNAYDVSFHLDNTYKIFDPSTNKNSVDVCGSTKYSIWVNVGDTVATPENPISIPTDSTYKMKGHTHRITVKNLNDMDPCSIVAINFYDQAYRYGPSQVRQGYRFFYFETLELIASPFTNNMVGLLNNATMPHLKRLIISDTRMHGKISEIDFSPFSELEYVDLHNTPSHVDYKDEFKLTGVVPLSLCNSTIKYLDISGNDLDGFAEGWDWDLMTSIEHIDVSNNPRFTYDLDNLITSIQAGGLTVLKFGNTLASASSGLETMANFLPNLVEIEANIGDVTGQLAIPTNIRKLGFVGQSGDTRTNIFCEGQIFNERCFAESTFADSDVISYCPDGWEVADYVKTVSTNNGLSEIEEHNKRCDTVHKCCKKTYEYPNAENEANHLNKNIGLVGAANTPAAYNDLKKSCENWGGRLPTTAELCPDGGAYTTPIVSSSENDMWTPVHAPDGQNQWVQIGKRSGGRCNPLSSVDSNQGTPTWMGPLPKYYKGEFTCMVGYNQIKYDYSVQEECENAGGEFLHHSGRYGETDYLCDMFPSNSFLPMDIPTSKCYELYPENGFDLGARCADQDTYEDCMNVVKFPASSIFGLRSACGWLDPCVQRPTCRCEDSCLDNKNDLCTDGIHGEYDDRNSDPVHGDVCRETGLDGPWSCPKGCSTTGYEEDNIEGSGAPWCVRTGTAEPCRWRDIGVDSVQCSKPECSGCAKCNTAYSNRVPCTDVAATPSTVTPTTRRLLQENKKNKLKKLLNDKQTISRSLKENPKFSFWGYPTSPPTTPTPYPTNTLPPVFYITGYPTPYPTTPYPTNTPPPTHPPVQSITYDFDCTSTTAIKNCRYPDLDQEGCPDKGSAEYDPTQCLINDPTAFSVSKSAVNHRLGAGEDICEYAMDYRAVCSYSCQGDTCFTFVGTGSSPCIDNSAVFCYCENCQAGAPEVCPVTDGNGQILNCRDDTRVQGLVHSHTPHQHIAEHVHSPHGHEPHQHSPHTHTGCGGRTTDNACMNKQPWADDYLVYSTSNPTDVTGEKADTALEEFLRNTCLVIEGPHDNHIKFSKGQAGCLIWMFGTPVGGATLEYLQQWFAEKLNSNHGCHSCQTLTQEYPGRDKNACDDACDELYLSSGNSDDCKRGCTLMNNFAISTQPIQGIHEEYGSSQICKWIGNSGYSDIEKITIKNTMMGGNFMTSLSLNPDKIEELHLENTEFSGDISDLFKLHKLKKLYLENNHIGGDVQELNKICLPQGVKVSERDDERTKIRLIRRHRDKCLDENYNWISPDSKEKCRAAANDKRLIIGDTFESLDHSEGGCHVFNYNSDLRDRAYYGTDPDKNHNVLIDDVTNKYRLYDQSCHPDKCCDILPWRFAEIGINGHSILGKVSGKISQHNCQGNGVEQLYDNELTGFRAFETNCSVWPEICNEKCGKAPLTDVSSTVTDRDSACARATECVERDPTAFTDSKGNSDSQAYYVELLVDIPFEEVRYLEIFSDPEHLQDLVGTEVYINNKLVQVINDIQEVHRIGAIECPLVDEHSMFNSSDVVIDIPHCFEYGEWNKCSKCTTGLKSYITNPQKTYEFGCLYTDTRGDARFGNRGCECTDDAFCPQNTANRYYEICRAFEMDSVIE